MPVQIDETEYKNLATLHGLASRMLRNPEAKKLLERAHKIIDPNAPTPTLDAERQQNEPIEALRKQVEDLKAEKENEKAEREKAEKLAAIQRKIDEDEQRYRRNGWTAEGISEVKKLMEEKGILDFEIAASYVEKIHPPASPVTPSGSGAWNFMEGIQDQEADLKKLIETRGESSFVVDKMARDALAEVRGQQPRR